MIIRKYIVNDMREALVRAKYELGKEAIIISHKKVRPGNWFNPFRKKRLEVTIAIEEDIHEKNKTKKEELERTVKKRMAEKASPDFASKKNSRRFDKVFSNQERALERWEAYCKKNSMPQEDVTFEELKSFVEETYLENAFYKELKLSKINVFIGPTGVGKTTTIAKLASKEYLQNGQKVGLITIDTYRIAAVEQLKTYAGILGIPCETVNEPGEMRKKISRLSYCDMILIDTVGASPKNEDRIEDIKKYVDEIDGDKNNYLVLSMSADVDTNNSVLKKYKELNYDSMILTKFDEVKNYKNFWNIIENNVVPIQYFCYGQNVPEDIDESSLENVLTYLWSELAND